MQMRYDGINEFERHHFSLTHPVDRVMAVNDSRIPPGVFHGYTQDNCLKQVFGFRSHLYSMNTELEIRYKYEI